MTAETARLLIEGDLCTTQEAGWEMACTLTVDGAVRYMQHDDAGLKLVVATSACTIW